MLPSGFPNFGHLIEELPRRVETLSSVAIPACVTQFDNQPSDGHCTPAPRMLLVADVGEDGLVDTGMSAMQEDISGGSFILGRRRAIRSEASAGVPLSSSGR